jgi:hypothetical protein
MRWRNLALCAVWFVVVGLPSQAQVERVVGEAKGIT